MYLDEKNKRFEAQYKKIGGNRIAVVKFAATVRESVNNDLIGTCHVAFSPDGRMRPYTIRSRESHPNAFFKISKTIIYDVAVYPSDYIVKTTIDNVCHKSSIRVELLRWNGTRLTEIFVSDLKQKSEGEDFYEFSLPFRMGKNYHYQKIIKKAINMNFRNLQKSGCKV